MCHSNYCYIRQIIAIAIITMREFMRNYKKYLDMSSYGVQVIMEKKIYLVEKKQIKHFNIVVRVNPTGDIVEFLILKQYWSLNMTFHVLPYIQVKWYVESNIVKVSKHFRMMKRGEYTSIAL